MLDSARTTRSARSSALSSLPRDRAAAALRAELRGLGAPVLPAALFARSLVATLVHAHDLDPVASNDPFLQAGPLAPDRLAGFLPALTREVARYLGGSRGTRVGISARVLVGAATALVRDLVLSRPPGPARLAAEREVTRLVGAYTVAVMPRQKGRELKDSQPGRM